MSYSENFNHELIKSAKNVVIAFSGGADSSSLLHYMCCNFQTKKISAFYLHHGLRDEADQEQQFCANVCKELNVEFYTARINIRKESKRLKKCIEDTGRIYRYEALKQCADSIEADTILTAHHLNDQTESILMQLFTGSSGLRVGIQDTMRLTDKIQVIRPMLSITKEMIYDYIERHDVLYIVDHSNYETDFKRNKLRNIIIPMIKKSINPNVDLAIQRYKLLSDEYSQYIDNITLEELQCLSQARKLYNLQRYIDLHPVIQHEILKKLIIRYCPSQVRFSKESLKNIRLFLLSESVNRQYRLCKDISLYKSYDTFYFDSPTNEQNTMDIPYVLKMGNNQIGSHHLTVKKVKHPKINKLDRHRIIVDRNNVNIDSLICRYRRTGDRFKPLGMKRYKKVKDFFIDRKVPIRERDETFIITDREKIIWIVGYEIDDRVKITEESQEYLELSYKE